MDEEDDVVNEIVESVVDGVTGLAVPLPKTVKRSFWKAMGGLITGLADVPAAWLELKAQGYRDERAARSLVADRVADAAAADLATDPELVRRAALYLGDRFVREQRNREEVARGAAEQLRAEPPKRDSDDEIDDDWMNMFARVAEQRSGDEMRAYLAKVLSGEICKPGSFSPSTVQVLATLGAETARKFQDLCSISFTWQDDDGDRAGPVFFDQVVGQASRNGLAGLGLTFGRLMDLQDAGLINLTPAALKATADHFLGPSRLGSSVLKARALPGCDRSREIECGIVLFTRAGRELQRVVHMTPNAAYQQSFARWVKDLFEVEVDLSTIAGDKNA